MRCFLLLFMLQATACSHPESFPTGKVIDTVACKADPSQTYALYIPPGNNGAVIYCFDAHGAGVLPLNNYKTLADKYGYILVGSNNSKNGNDWGTTENIWQALEKDTRARLHIDTSHVYALGFSGGAKVAGYVALNHPGIKAVIVNGAGLPDGTPPADFPFTYTTLAGEGDLNLTDLLGYHMALNKTNTKHHLIPYNGKHEWAPATAMDIAFAGIKADEGAAPPDFMARSRTRMEMDVQSNQFLKAETECRLLLSYMPNDNFFKNQLDIILSNPAYKTQSQEQMAVLVKEQNTKAAYNANLGTQDTAYWPKTIRSLNAGAQLPSFEGAMNQRLLAYLSLMFYSVSNHYIASHTDDVARHFVDLYELADPTNSEAYYFSAILYARAGDAAHAETALQQAVNNGFKDKVRYEQQPEFAHIKESVKLHF
ncbi:hypothetical protein [Chitinophaga sp.]|uniref:hypothetical protein n=1 Tax=Chitinophaga sp. TaxID=1869181 RepID=UPI0031E2772F